MPFIPQEAEGTSDEIIQVNMVVDLEKIDRGTIHFYMGPAPEPELPEVESIPISISPYVNDNMERLLTAFRMGGVDHGSMTRSVLDNPGKLNITEMRIGHSSQRDFFGLSLDIVFNYEVKGADAEYQYLDFIRKVDDLFKNPTGNLGIITGNVAKERELSRIRISLEVVLPKGASITSSTKVSDHERTIYRETFEDHRSASTFMRSSNRIKVFDLMLISPGITFAVMTFFLILGNAVLGYIWWRERFKSWGLVLPIATMIFSLVLPWLYFNPNISFYNIGGGTIWIAGSFFLGLVLACNYFNPKHDLREFEEELKDQPTVKMPDVIYVNKRVYVEKKVKMDEVEHSDPYEVLEIKKGADFDDIERAYRNKIKEYHPDKYSKSPPRIAVAAKKETEKLNIAYEKMKKLYGK
jgi:hypothetical protein